MDKLINMYPVYSPDQVLTNKSLNNSFDYLNQQERTTRSGMIGHGVVCGLNYTVGYGKLNGSVDAIPYITIDPGYGNSIDGYILQWLADAKLGTLVFDKATKYTRPVEVLNDQSNDGSGGGGSTGDLPSPSTFPTTLPATPESPSATLMAKTAIASLAKSKVASKITVAKNRNTGIEAGKFFPIDPLPTIWDLAYELIPASITKIEGKTLDPLTTFLKETGDYVLFLYLEITDVKSENCSPEDCDEKGKIRKLRVVPLIAPALYFNEQHYTTAHSDIIRLRRMTDYENQHSARALNNEYARINNINVNFVKNALNNLVKNFSSDYSMRINQSKEENIIANFSNFIDSSVLSGNNQIQYGYDFLLDLELAINEYIQHTNCLPVTTCNFADYRYNRVLALGKIKEVNIFTDQKRYRFVEAPSVQEDNQQKMIAYKLYKRVWDLIDAYLNWVKSMNISSEITIANAENGWLGITISPSRSAPSFIGMRALPFYYNLPNDFGSENLLQTWVAHTCSNRSNLDIYGYNLNRPDKVAHTFDFNDYILLNAINEYNFFRIEGHVGMLVDEAEKYINSLINKQNLPFRTFRLQLKRNAIVKRFVDQASPAVASASAKLRKASGINIEAAAAAPGAVQFYEQMPFANADSYFEQYAAVGFNGGAAPQIVGDPAILAYTKDDFEVTFEYIKSTPSLIPIDLPIITAVNNIQKTELKFKVVGTSLGNGIQNKVFAGEVYTISVVYNKDYLKAVGKPIAPNPAVIVTKTAATAAPAPSVVASKAKTAVAMDSQKILVANIARYLPYDIPTASVTAVDGDTVESIAQKLAAALLRARDLLMGKVFNPPPNMIIVSAFAVADEVHIQSDTQLYQYFYYNINTYAQGVDSNMVHYLGVNYTGAGGLLSSVEITVCNQENKPGAFPEKTSRVVMSTGQHALPFPADITNYLIKPEAYTICAVKPIVKDPGDGGGGPIDTEYNTWPFDAKGNLLFNIFKGAEHLAGVYRGGTFIFLTENVLDQNDELVEVVIGDIALPWDLEYVKLSKAIALKFNRKYWIWGTAWESLPTFGIK
jgi:hypothetical protein